MNATLAKKQLIVLIKKINGSKVTEYGCYINQLPSEDRKESSLPDSTIPIWATPKSN